MSNYLETDFVVLSTTGYQTADIDCVGEGRLRVADDEDV